MFLLLFVPINLLMKTILWMSSKSSRNEKKVYMCFPAQNLLSYFFMTGRNFQPDGFPLRILSPKMGNIAPRKTTGRGQTIEVKQCVPFNLAPTTRFEVSESWLTGSPSTTWSQHFFAQGENPYDKSNLLTKKTPN